MGSKENIHNLLIFTCFEMDSWFSHTVFVDINLFVTIPGTNPKYRNQITSDKDQKD